LSVISGEQKLCRIFEDHLAKANTVHLRFYEPEAKNPRAQQPGMRGLGDCRFAGGLQRRLPPTIAGNSDRLPRSSGLAKLTLGGPPLLLGDQQFLITIDDTKVVIEADEQNNFLAGRVRMLPSRARAVLDQTDTHDVTVHPVYAVPAGTMDEQWVINGTIENIVADLQTWLRDRTGGRGIVWDEADGTLDITFVRLVQTETELAELADRWLPIAEELYSRGLNDLIKIYAVWYPFAQEDSETLVCGVQTEYRSVTFAFSFFQRVAGGPNLCINQPVTMVHELFHAFGAVAPCATNYFSGPGSLRTRHVDDDPNDLLYDGDRIGFATELDQGHDDYFGHDIPGCIDIADSPYLEPED